MVPPLPPPRRGFRGFLRAVGHGINLTRLIIINLVFFSVLGVIVLLLTAGIAGSRMEREVADQSVLVLKPQGDLVEQYSIDPVQRALAGLSGEDPKQVQLRDLTRAIDAAASDKRITRILLLPGDMRSGGFAALREVGAALERFRAAGKPVIAWGVNLDQSQYYLAAHADQLLLDPQGGVLLTGLANYRLYYKDLLDKLGVDVHLFRVGQFKSAAEPYILDHASDAAKQADRYWLGGLWDTWLAEVAKLRKLDPATLRADVDNLPAHIADTDGDLAQLAVRERLADGTATHEQLIRMMRAAGVPADKKGHGIRQVGMTRYLASLGTSDRDRGRGVVVVVAEGEITGGKQASGAIGGESTAALIREARQDRKTAALVLRVNSPGGEVYPAEQIRREVELTRAAGIPVVVSMGDVAASGGYWIGMNANRILAEPNTITGSIGIFGLFYTVPGTLAKFGVSSDGVGTGPLAGAFDASRPLNPNVGAVIQAGIDKGYRDFVGKVAKARGQTFAVVDGVAQGRVWTGEQAQQRGLVDRLGGLRDAVADAAALAKLGEHYPVRYQEAPLGTLARVLAGFNQHATAQLLRSWGVQLPTWWAQLPAVVPELQWLRHAKAGTPNVYADCLCRLR